MATTPRALLNARTDGSEVTANDTERIQWTLAAGESGDAVYSPTLSDRTVQFSGVFGGATVGIQGTVDGTVWQPVTDPQGNAISKSVSSLEAISENCWAYKPVVTGGDGTTAIIITLMSRRSIRG